MTDLATDHLTFELADPDGHGELLRAWGHEAHVAPWWSELRRPLAEVRAYLADQQALAHLDPWIVHDDGEPVAYVETYVAADDPLAAHYDARPGDRGWHVLVGPPERLGTGLAHALGRAVLDRLLAQPDADRVVCEPDARNERMIRFCRRLGFEPVAELALPTKRALLLACSTPRPTTAETPS